jgi:serine/threonine-protein kinase OSR1/STK39
LFGSFVIVHENVFERKFCVQNDFWAGAKSRIRHPNVLVAYCSFTANHTVWVVMPFMAGGSCLEIMKAAFADGFDEALVSTFLKESLMGLNHLHQHGRIHQDVKVLRCCVFRLMSSI